MFLDNIPGPVRERMQALEQIDARDRADGSPIHKRLRQIPPESGHFLALLAASAPEGTVLEIGASAGYSALWIVLACQQRGDKLDTFELLPEKAEQARETFKKAGVETFVELVHGDARGHLKEYDEVAFCFLDVEKEMYAECYDLVVPNLVAGGLLVADNALSHAEELAAFIEAARADQSVDALVLPIGKGLLVCSKRAPQIEEEVEEIEKPKQKKTRRKRTSSKRS